MDQQLTIVDPDFVEEGLCVDKGEDHAYSRGGGLCLYQPLTVTGADQSKTRMLPLFITVSSMILHLEHQTTFIEILPDLVELRMNNRKCKEEGTFSFITFFQTKTN